MRILEINDYPGEAGGAERHFQSLCRLLEAKGDQVETFHSLAHFTRKRAGDVRSALSQLLSEQTFDIAHIHVLDHPFLSLLHILENHSIPIVQTMHDHRAICSATAMLRKGSICRDCRGGRHYWAGIHGCINLPMALKLFCQSTVSHENPYRAVKFFISPSNFLINTFKEWGFKGNFTYLPHFLELEQYKPSYEDSGYILFFGRLTAIKGIKTLLSALKDLDIPLHIAGGGELEGEIRESIASWKTGKVTLLGHLGGEALNEAVRKSRFTVVPSECYENSPFAIMEAFALGKPVVGSNLGGIPELIGNNLRGILFPPGNVEKLRESILTLWNDPALVKELGWEARSYAVGNFPPEHYYHRLMDIFASCREPGGK